MCGHETDGAGVPEEPRRSSYSVDRKMAKDRLERIRRHLEELDENPTEAERWLVVAEWAKMIAEQSLAVAKSIEKRGRM